MPVKALRIPLEEGKYYHVYNRGNNKDRLFFSTADYYFFLRKYYNYLDTYVETYAYCILPNHFHFLVRVKEDGNGGATSVSNQFRKLFICHTMRVNSINGRKGCLMSRNFRREEVIDERYLMNVIRYIHLNPVKHGYITQNSSYLYCSFYDVLANKNPYVKRTEILNLFGGMEQFLEFHRYNEMEKDIIGAETDT